jgi:hypothetical protein
MDHSLEQKSLQIWGRATLITRKSNEQEFMDRVEKWGIREMAKALVSPHIKRGELTQDKLDVAVEKMLDSLNLIKIEPEKIVMRVYQTDFFMPKFTWTKEWTKE